MLTMPCLDGEVILGVDTHRDVHAAVLVDRLGCLIASQTFPTTRSGAQGADRVGAAPRHRPPRGRGRHRQLRCRAHPRVATAQKPTSCRAPSMPGERLVPGVLEDPATTI